MTLREDLNRPLPNVENALLRRFVTIVLGVVFLPVLLLYGVVESICENIKYFWVKWIKDCW